MSIATYSIGGNILPDFPKSGSIQYELNSLNKLTKLSIIAGEGGTLNIDLLLPPSTGGTGGTGNVEKIRLPDYLYTIPTDGAPVVVPEGHKQSILNIINRTDIPTPELLMSGNISLMVEYGFISRYSYSELNFTICTFNVLNDTDAPQVNSFLITSNRSNGNIEVLRLLGSVEPCDCVECPDCPPADLSLYSLPDWLLNVTSGTGGLQITDSNQLRDISNILSKSIPTFPDLLLNRYSELPKWGIWVDVTAGYSSILAKKAVGIYSINVNSNPTVKISRYLILEEANGNILVQKVPILEENT